MPISALSSSPRTTIQFLRSHIRWSYTTRVTPPPSPYDYRFTRLGQHFGDHFSPISVFNSNRYKDYISVNMRFIVLSNGRNIR